jgi:type II secretory pathway component PulM
MKWLQREVAGSSDHWARVCAKDPRNVLTEVEDMTSDVTFRVPRANFSVGGAHFVLLSAQLTYDVCFWTGTPETLALHREKLAEEKAAEAEAKRVARNARAAEARRKKKARLSKE